MKVNTHGLKMVGLKEAASETKYLTNCGGYLGGHYVQISYDRATGEILTNYHCSLGKNEWSAYHDKDIITIGNVSEPVTMQTIADMIADAIEYRDAEEYQRSLYQS